MKTDPKAVTGAAKCGRCLRNHATEGPCTSGGHGHVNGRVADAPVRTFHAHLEVCAQCANRPFDLCSDGALLLAMAAQAP
jgi:hypothetical protein